MRPTSQFRFVQTTMTSGRPCLSPEVKFLAMYSMDDGRLAVLAQGKDKYTLKKWAGLLRVRLHTVGPVDDMKQALEFAKHQPEFEQQGSLCHQRGGKQGQQQEPRPKPKVSKEHEPAPVLVRKPTRPNPAYQMAHAAAEQMRVRLEFEEESRRIAHAECLGIETDVDHMFVRPVQANPVVSPHVAARQAALQYIQRLQHAGKLFSQDCIPRALRKCVPAHRRDEHVMDEL